MKYKIAIAILLATFIALCAGIAKAQTPETPFNVSSTQNRVVTWQTTTLPDAFIIERSFEYDGTVRAIWGTTIPVTDAVCADPDGDGVEQCTYNYGAAWFTKSYANGIYTFTYFDYGCYTGSDFQSQAAYFLNTVDGGTFRIVTNMRNPNFKASVVWRVRGRNGNTINGAWSLYTIPVQP